MNDKDNGAAELVVIPKTTEIVISPDYGLSVDPDWVEVGQGSTVVFRADKVKAKVFFPERVLEPASNGAKQASEVGGDYLVFDIVAGQSLEFTAGADAAVKLEYFVSRKLFSGLIEAVQVPPVFIIKQVDI